MGVKTITIDLEAYATLARRKRPGQSFSQVIKEHLGSVRTGAELKRAVEGLVVPDAILDAVDRQLGFRRRSRARAPRL